MIVIDIQLLHIYNYNIYFYIVYHINTLRNTYKYGLYLICMNKKQIKEKRIIRRQQQQQQQHSFQDTKKKRDSQKRIRLFELKWV
jgi:hypothetical protein